MLGELPPDDDGYLPFDPAEAERLRQQEAAKPITEVRAAARPKVVPIAPELPWFRGSDLTWPPEADQYVSRHLAITSDRVTLLSGPPACGKGFLALHIALSTLPGSAELGELGRFDEQGPVGWLDYEEGRRALGRRFLRAYYGRSPDEPDASKMHILDATSVPAWKLSAGAFAAHLAAEVRRLGLKLLVVDSLHACAAVEDPNSASAAAPLQTLDALGKATGCAVLVLAHTRKLPKEGGTDPSQDDVRGTSAYAGVAGSIWNGKRKGGQAGVLWTHTKCSSHRESDPFVLTWDDEESGALTIRAQVQKPVPAGGEALARAQESADLQQRILQLVSERPGINAEALVAMLDARAVRVRGQLSVLELNGVLHMRSGKRGAKLYHPGPPSADPVPSPSGSE